MISQGSGDLEIRNSRCFDVSYRSGNPTSTSVSHQTSLINLTLKSLFPDFIKVCLLNYSGNERDPTPNTYKDVLRAL